jgi:hypothetical protein
MLVNVLRSTELLRVSVQLYAMFYWMSVEYSIPYSVRALITFDLGRGLWNVHDCKLGGMAMGACPLRNPS